MITPTRAAEILANEKAYRDARKLWESTEYSRHMTAEEISEVRARWQTMAGTASFHAALRSFLESK